MIRKVEPRDVEAIGEIYNHYVLHSIATFEESPVGLDELDRRFERATAQFPWLVYEEGDSVLAYAYATPWKGRSGYRHSVESTVYVAPHAAGRGLGEQIYRELISRLSQGAVRSILAGIALPNDASVRLHEKLGFEKVAHLRQVGYKFERWIDVGYWQWVIGDLDSQPIR